MVKHCSQRCGCGTFASRGNEVPLDWKVDRPDREKLATVYIFHHTHVVVRTTENIQAAVLSLDGTAGVQIIVKPRVWNMAGHVINCHKPRLRDSSIKADVTHMAICYTLKRRHEMHLNCVFLVNALTRTSLLGCAKPRKRNFLKTDSNLTEMCGSAQYL
jgi:hypothetical protein